MLLLSLIHLLRCFRYVPMLRKLTEYVFALCDLLEAQGRALRDAARRMALGIVVLFLGGLLMATGLGFLIASAYLILALALEPWAGALIVGGSVLVLGALVAWAGLRATH